MTQYIPFVLGVATAAVLVAVIVGLVIAAVVFVVAFCRAAAIGDEQAMRALVIEPGPKTARNLGRPNQVTGLDRLTPASRADYLASERAAWARSRRTG